MSNVIRRGIFIVAGYGTGAGTGAASAVEFAKAGYKVALVARGVDAVQNSAESLKAKGFDAVAFPLPDYSNESIHSLFQSVKQHWPNEPIRVTLWNASAGVFKPFLETTEEEWQTSATVNFLAPAAFAKESILAFKDLDLTPEGARGTLLFTGATSAWRGNRTTAAFSAGKFALRSLSQSLNKEFGKQNIHVAHAIIDGSIKTARQVNFRGAEWAANEDVRLSPEGIAKSYVYLAHQDRSAWTWELDLRPAHETW